MCQVSEWRRFGDASSVSFFSIMNSKWESKGRWQKPQYRQAFLMRLWREDTDASWRIMLQTIHDGERENFPTVESFIVHLEKLLEVQK